MYDLQEINPEIIPDSPIIEHLIRIEIPFYIKKYIFILIQIFAC